MKPYSLIASIIDRELKRLTDDDVPNQQVSRPAPRLFSGTVLDGVLKNLRRGSLVVIASRPSVGHEVLTKQIAFQTATRGHPTLVLTPSALAWYPMGTIEHLLTGQQAHDLSSMSTMARLERVRSALNDVPLYLAELVQRTPSEIIRRCREMKHDLNPDAIVIDADEILTYDRHASCDRHRSLPQILKLLAESLNTILVVSCGLPRAVEERRDKHPILDDLSEHGELTEVADLVLLTYWDHVYHEQSDPEEAIVFIAKSRYGPIEYGLGLRYREHCFHDYVEPHAHPPSGLQTDSQ